MSRKLAQPSEPVTSPARWVTCSTHYSVHRERTTCVQPQDGQPGFIPAAQLPASAFPDREGDINPAPKGTP